MFIEGNFEYHEPTDEMKVRMLHIRNVAKDFARMIEAVCYDGREKSLALTKLEEATMWANASITRNAE